MIDFTILRKNGVSALSFTLPTKEAEQLGSVPAGARFPPHIRSFGAFCQVLDFRRSVMSEV